MKRKEKKMCECCQTNVATGQKYCRVCGRYLVVMLQEAYNNGRNHALRQCKALSERLSK